MGLLKLEGLSMPRLHGLKSGGAGGFSSSKISIKKYQGLSLWILILHV